MIRINLLPVRQSRKREAGKQWLALFALTFVAALVGNYFWWNATAQNVVAINERIATYERDVAKIEPGQKVTFTVMGGGPEEQPTAYEGKVTWVGTEVDQTTRTTKVRAELPNPAGKLRAHQFGKARIELGKPHRVLTVAKAAVQRYENVDLVFLTEKPGVYRPQRIKAPGVNAIYDLMECIETGKKPECDGEDGLKALEAAVALRESHRQGGRKVELPLEDRTLMIRSMEVLRGDLPVAIQRRQAAANA